MTIVSFDAFGRLLIPSFVRKLFATRRFALEVKDEEIVLRPVKTWKELFGSLPGPGLNAFKKLHEA